MLFMIQCLDDHLLWIYSRKPLDTDLTYYNSCLTHIRKKMNFFVLCWRWGERWGQGIDRWMQLEGWIEIMRRTHWGMHCNICMCRLKSDNFVNKFLTAIPILGWASCADWCHVLLWVFGRDQVYASVNFPTSGTATVIGKIYHIV